MTNPTGEEDAITFATRILALLEEGQFVATYKFALLLALIDLALERADEAGRLESIIPVRDVAEKVIELYWPQADDFSHGHALFQNEGQKHVAVVSKIRKLKPGHTARSALTLSRLRRDKSGRYESLVRATMAKLIEDPIPRLQTIREREDIGSFIYVHTDSPEPGLRLSPGVAGHFLRLSPLLRPLICQKWAQKVAKINKLKMSRLEDFLFRTERSALDRVRVPLLHHQGHLCFYCRRRIRTSIEVDHFIPWARYRDNGIHNLVVAHAACNRNKRDSLAAETHIERWVMRVRADSEERAHLDELAQTMMWDSDASRSFRVARNIYLGLPEGYPLWQSKTRLDSADLEELRRLFLRVQIA